MPTLYAKDFAYRCLEVRLQNLFSVWAFKRMNTNASDFFPAKLLVTYTLESTSRREFGNKIKNSLKFPLNI